MDRALRCLSKETTGIRIRIHRGGTKVFEETIKGNAESKSLLARARKRRDYVEECLDLGLPIDEEDNPTTGFPEACESWLYSLETNDTDTIHKYGLILENNWIPHFGGLTAQQISTPMIRRVMAGWGVKQVTKKKRLSPLKQVLDHVGVKPNPAASWQWNKKLGRVEKHKVERHTPEQRAAVIEALDDIHRKAVEAHQEAPRARYERHWAEQARVYFPMLYAGGLRPGEALAPSWEDYAAPVIHIYATHTRNKRKEATKTGGRRRVYLPEWFRPRLEEHTTRFAKTAIFTNTFGRPLKDTKRLVPIFRRALAECGYKDQDPYVCRHSRAAELLSMGRATIAECAHYMGHSIQVFEDVYAEFIEEYRGRPDFSHLEASDGLEIAEELPSEDGEASGELIYFNGNNSLE